MNPLFAQLALDWLEAERAAHPDLWPLDRPTRDEMTVAVDRVYSVITGEVKWSETSPGDKAIWKSRVEAIPTFARSWRRDGTLTDEALKELIEAPPDESLLSPLGGPVMRGGDRRPRGPETIAEARARGARIEGIRERLWWNYYDTLPAIDHDVAPDFGGDSFEIRMFGNRNVGNPWLSNLQIGGVFPGDSSFIVLGLYVTTSSLEALHWAARRVGFTFIIGDRPMTPMLFVSDLFRGVPLTTPKARPLVIPVRQSYNVLASFKERPPRNLPAFDLTFHFEGLRTREIQ